MSTLKGVQLTQLSSHLNRVKTKMNKKIEVNNENIGTAVSNILQDLIKLEAIIGPDSQYQPEEYFQGYI